VTDEARTAHERDEKGNDIALHSAALYSAHVSTSVCYLHSSPKQAVL